ncbi:MAG: DNA primase [Spirochaetaceae bacterium]|jgi:DNA primase|nr:DNA primase [Spirochaetaceae bacterium]
MPRISDATKKQVQDQLDAVAIVGEYVRLQKKSGRWWGCCPFHEEKTPSFTVTPDKKTYYCFGCHKGGDIFDFIMEEERLSFPEALEFLAKKTGVPIVYDENYQESDEDARQKQIAAAEKDALYELYRRVTDTFHYFLSENKAGAAALAYIKGRGIDDATIKAFKLGYIPAGRNFLHDFLLKKGYSNDFLARSGLFSQRHPGSPFFFDRLMFPICDREGRPVAFSGRILAGDGPKYINSPESSIYHKGKTLFGIDRAMPEIRRTKSVYLVEGNLDVVAMHQAGVRNTVAPLGTAFTEEQAKLLRHWADTLYLLFDSDDAGQNATVKAILTARNAGLIAKVINLQEGKDSAEILQKKGPEALTFSLTNSILDYDYLVRRAGQLFNIQSAEGKTQAENFVFPFIQTQKTSVERESRFNDLAFSLQVNVASVVEDYNRWNGGRRAEKPLEQSQATQNQSEITMNSELYLMSALFLNPEYFKEVRTKIKPEEFADTNARELYIVMEESFRSGEMISGKSAEFADNIKKIPDEKLRNFMLKQAASPYLTVEPEKLISGGIKKMKMGGLEARRGEIELRLLRGGENLTELLEEKRQIDMEIKRLNGK